jgi:hypothetical protein
VKLGFFRNEHLCELSPYHRLLFQGLWLLADRAGRLEDRPRRITADLFPFDRDVNVDAMLMDLSTSQFITRYEAEGQKLIQVNNFSLHQRPHPKEPVSTFPAPVGYECDEAVKKHGATMTSRLGREGDLGDLRKGMENGEEARRPEHLRQVWNDLCGTLPKCLELSDQRQRRAYQRLNDRPFEQWAQIVDRIAGSTFCNGDNDRGWKATFDWLIQPDTAAKVLEGKYDNRPAKKARPEISDHEFFRIHGYRRPAVNES